MPSKEQLVSISPWFSEAVRCAESNRDNFPDVIYYLKLPMVEQAVLYDALPDKTFLNRGVVFGEGLDRYAVIFNLHYDPMVFDPGPAVFWFPDDDVSRDVMVWPEDSLDIQVGKS